MSAWPNSARKPVADRPARRLHRSAKAGELKQPEAYSMQSTCLSIYDGRTCIGHLLSRGKAGVEAFDSDARILGVFPDPQSAAAAIRAKARAMSNTDLLAPDTKGEPSMTAGSHNALAEPRCVRVTFDECWTAAKANRGRLPRGAGVCLPCDRAPHKPFVPRGSRSAGVARHRRPMLIARSLASCTRFPRSGSESSGLHHCVSRQELKVVHAERREVPARHQQWRVPLPSDRGQA